MDGSIIIIIDNHTSKNFNMKLKTWGFLPLRCQTLLFDKNHHHPAMAGSPSLRCFWSLCRTLPWWFGFLLGWSSSRGWYEREGHFWGRSCLFFFVFVLRLKELYINTYIILIYKPKSVQGLATSEKIEIVMWLNTKPVHVWSDFFF